MKSIWLLIIALIVGLLSCDEARDDQQNEINRLTLLTSGVWELNDSLDDEFLTFYSDMTYVIAGLTTAPVGSPVEDVKIAQVLGEWQLEDNKITFLTNFLEIDDPNSVIDELEVIEGQPIGLFYGEVVTWVDGTPIRTGPNYDPDFKPSSLTIIELTERSLILEGPSGTREYIKEN